MLDHARFAETLRAGSCGRICLPARSRFRPQRALRKSSPSGRDRFPNRRSRVRIGPMAREKLPIHAVILAGGRGTRFWPSSRTKTPKQLLQIVGKGTMLEQTVARIRPIADAGRIWTVTNLEQQARLRKQLPQASRERVLVEPVGRNTAAAIALASLHIQKAAKGDVLMAVLPADHYIEDVAGYRKIVTLA